MDPTPHLERFETYEQAFREFSWIIPERFNIAGAICRRHPDAITRVALKEVREAGINTYTFGALDFLSDKFARVLTESGIKQGDSVAVILPQSVALAVAHLGVLKAGAVLVPLPMGADPALLEHAIANSGARAVVIDESINVGVEAYPILSNLELSFIVRDLRPSATSSKDKDFWTVVDRASSDFDAMETDSNSRAFIFYVGSEGKPQAVVHSHRSLIGQLPSFEMFMEPDADAVFWTSDAWSSANALLGVLYPSWWYGCAVVAGGSDERESVLRLMERSAVTHACVPSTALSMLARSEPRDSERLESKLRIVVCESLPWPDDWPADGGVSLNCVYGRPETGWMVGRRGSWFKTGRSSKGRPAPGRLIEVLDDAGNILRSPGTGRVAIHKSDPALFGEFLDASRNAAEPFVGAFVGDWYLTGDVGQKNEDGELSILHPLTW